MVPVPKGLVARRSKSQTILCDQGTEFTSMAMDHWAYCNQIGLAFSRSGRLGYNARNEVFNGTLRDKCLNVNWFLSHKDASDKIEEWRIKYNEFRLHGSLENLTPQKFVELFCDGHRNQKSLLLAGSVFG